MPRNKLPSRRQLITAKADWKTDTAEHSFHITAGFDPRSGEIMEVFYADGQKSGTNLRDTVQDACILISMLLQYGAPLSEINKSLCITPVFGKDMPASIIGVIATALQELSVEISSPKKSQQSYPPKPSKPSI